MVVWLHPKVVVGDEHFVVPDNGTNGRSGWQIDFVQAFANHLGGTVVAVGDGLNGFGRAPAQGVHVHHITPAHVGKQAADGGLLG